ncbi:MAG: hypothetical protein HOP02_08160, partial [Methylococcaceae bacterium]|nr:hypothetical protein [Methylococcaceae bacterium]
ATSTGSPAPAGLSTSLHSSQLNTALGIVAGYSNPVLFNNIFWDNRAGARSGSTVTGIGATGDATAINPWDLGSTDIGALLAPINSFVQQTSGYTDAASNRHVDPAVVTPYDTVLDFAAWRTNPAFIGAIMVTLDVPPTLSGDYHLLTGSPAINLGVAGPISGVSAPTLDIDDGTRTGLPDVGADEQGVAGLGLGSGTGGGGTGPILPTLAVLDNFNRANANTLNNGTNWNQVTIATTAPLTFIGNALCNAAGFGTTAPCAAVHITGPAASGIANAVANGNAYWSSNFNANQAAAFTFANTPLNNTALMLKATGANSGLSGLQANFIRVQYQTTGGGRIVVSTTNNGNNLAPTYTTSATFTTNANFANGNTLSAVIRANGTVEVFKTSSSTISLGSVQLPNVALWTTGGGRIGMQLPSSARVDNFAGGTVP